MKKSEYFIVFMVCASLAVSAIAILSLTNEGVDHSNHENKTADEPSKTNSIFQDFGELIYTLFDKGDSEDDSRIQDNGELIDSRIISTVEDVEEWFYEINDSHEAEDELKYVVKHK